MEHGRLCRLMQAAAATSNSLTALRLEYRPDPREDAVETLDVGMTADEARAVADLLNRAADRIDRGDDARRGPTQPKPH